MRVTRICTPGLKQKPRIVAVTSVGTPGIYTVHVLNVLLVWLRDKTVIT